MPVARPQLQPSEPTGAVRPASTLQPTPRATPTQGLTGELMPTPTITAREAATRVVASTAPTPTLSMPEHRTAGGARQGLLRLANDLDDPQGYCVDVTGFGANIRLDAPLQAHTCKGRSDDQMFEVLEGGGIRLIAFGRCLGAREAVSGSAVSAVECNPDAEAQGFQMDTAGMLALASPDGYALCLGVAAGSGEPAGGRNHLRRDLMLYRCDEAERPSSSGPW